MGEGLSNPESRRPVNRIDSLQMQFRTELRASIQQAMAKTEDFASWEIGNKILEKLDIKDRVDDLVAGRNDVHWYQSMKYLGVFVVVDRKCKFDYEDPEHGIDIKRGDRILELHLPPMSEEEKQQPFYHIQRSMQMVAQYIIEQDLEPSYIVATTYERLAKISKRQGFTVVAPEIPEDMKRAVERVYDRFNIGSITDTEMGKILLCFQKAEEFMERYLKD